MVGSLFGLFSVPVFSAEKEFFSEQETLRQWIDVKKTVSREAADWVEEKQRLTDLNTIRCQELAQLDEQLARTETLRAQADEKKAELIARFQALETHRAELQARIGPLEEQLRSLRERLPEPLIKKLPTALDSNVLQDRWRDLLAQLDTIRDFQQAITVTSEIREIDGTRIDVDVLYLGLAQAWYVDRSGKQAGIGAPVSNHWNWESRSELAAPIRRAIDIADKQETPDFVQLPIQPVGGTQ